MNRMKKPQSTVKVWAILRFELKLPPVDWAQPSLMANIHRPPIQCSRFEVVKYNVKLTTNIYQNIAKKKFKQAFYWEPR